MEGVQSFLEQLEAAGPEGFEDPEEFMGCLFFFKCGYNSEVVVG